MDLGLKGKRALVTGASRGLGYAIALILGEEGCQLVINSRNPTGIEAAAEKLRKACGAMVIPLPGDVADPALPGWLVEEAISRLGGLDLLVTNSGGPPSGKFESFEDAAWQQAIETNLMAHVRLIRAALPALAQSATASVLTITSYAVKQPIPNLVLSNSVRAATVGLTKSLALELGPQGIRVNSILPGWTTTERVNELMAARAKTKGTTTEEEIAKQAMESALGRMATPQELAKAAVFLLSPAASYLTGVMLSVDGGAYKGLL
jgi:3-oxoacyl-[acyl-carrier protein] reductase